MFKSKHCLLAGGVISAVISILHLILILKPELYSYVSPDQESALTQMAEQGSSFTTIVTIALALIFSIWAVYAFAGAGLFRPFPLLRGTIITIGVIYILRAFFLPSEINMVLTQGYPFKFVVFSSVSLVAGLLYLIGILKQRTSVPAGN